MAMETDADFFFLFQIQSVWTVVAMRWLVWKESEVEFTQIYIGQQSAQ